MSQEVTCQFFRNLHVDYSRIDLKTSQTMLIALFFDFLLQTYAINMRVYFTCLNVTVDFPLGLEQGLTSGF